MNTVTEQVKVIDEVRQLRDRAVARKQVEATLNFPKIIEIIKQRAAKGDSLCLIEVGQMNEYDMNLLVAEGFKCALIDRKYDRDAMNSLANFANVSTKVWEVKW